MKFVNFFFYIFFYFYFLWSPGRDQGVQSAIIFFVFVLFLFIFLYFFFMSLPGRQIYIFLTPIFFFYVPSGASNFYFLTSKKLYHMKFAIFDVARCRMSATSLTFWFLLSFSEKLFKRSYFKHIHSEEEEFICLLTYFLSNFFERTPRYSPAEMRT